MKNATVKYGLIAGVILSIFILVTAPFMTADSNISTSETLGYSVMIITLGLTIYFGVKEFRDKVQGGFVSYGQVFVRGLLITLLAGVVYALTWTIYTSVADVDFGEIYSEMTLKKMQESGASDEEISLALEEIEAFMPYYDMPAVKFFITIFEPLTPGLIVSLLLGFVLKKKESISGT